MKSFSTLLLASLLLAGAAAIHAAETVEITEWPVPWENSRPRDPYVDNQNRVWFVGQVGNYLAYLDPRTGEFKRYELDEGTGPHNLIVDNDGDVWYAGNRAAHIGRLDPGTGEITKYPMPDPAARDPHTLVFDQNGDIWFTVQGGNFIGKLTTATGDVRLVQVQTSRARPYGIVIDSHNRPWFCLFGSDKIGMIDPDTMVIREIPMPREEARPRRLMVTSDDRIFYVDYAGGFLGRFNPQTGETQEWEIPGGPSSRPYGMAVDDHDRLWFVETGLDPNRLIGFDPTTREFFSVTEIASGGGTVRHMFFHEPTREIWFGTDTNNIGRAKLP